MSTFDRRLAALHAEDERRRQLRSRLPAADAEHADWDVVAGLEDLAAWADGSIGLDELGRMDGLA